jgi:protein-tyrosine phosphatase
MPDVVQIFETGDYEAQVQQGAKLLADGGVVVMPTETVYGAAAAITHERGRARLRALRGNSGSDGKPFTVHLAYRNEAERYLGNVSDLGRRMMTKLWPGPVALVFEVAPERQKEVSNSLKLSPGDLYADDLITLRCPDHIVATDLLAQVPAPVALTLVNVRMPKPNWQELDAKVDLVFDAGPTRFSKPSTILRVRENNYEIVREGIYDHRIIERLLRTTILFVCSGNTCRSAMSEALARRLLSEKLHVREDELESKGYSVISAGSFALPGSRATPQGVEAVKQFGADLSKHRSRLLSVELIHQADAIYTMSRNHAQAVVALVPAAAEKTFTLDPEADIEDPIGGDVSLYDELAKKLQELIRKRLEERKMV